MAKRIPEAQLAAIEAVLRDHPEGLGIDEIERLLDGDLPRRTLQYRLKYLVDDNRLVREGDRRWTVYRVADDADSRSAPGDQDDAENVIPISEKSAEIQSYVGQPLQRRRPVGYNRGFLESYRPNESAYFSNEERARLRKIGTAGAEEQPAGTYAKQIMGRLLIDLSWNSSRLEGNTYSLLDTRRLIAFGEEAEGREQLEAQMILNHKDAIEFLIGAADEIGFNRHTILNLHALLANNLLADPDATGRLRHIAVGIERSTFHPLEVPQLIEECFDHLLASAAAIEDPFEQSFFAMAQLPYLQPFDDVNKRVSRLAANIPFVKANLTPLAFTDVPRKLYTDAMLGVYELNKIDFLKDVYIWAYERSTERYAAVRQSLGQPDPFRLKHRAGLRQVVSNIVRGAMNRKSAIRSIAKWADENVEPAERERFREIAESEILALHDGNYARYQIRPSEFAAWQDAWR